MWTYTHAWRDVSRSPWGDVSVLASCETTEDVFWARQAGYATSVVVHDFPGDRRYVLEGEPLGQDVIPCPSMTRDVPCSDCRMCMDDERLRREGLSIGFAVHGIPLAQRAARRALERPGDPHRRTPSEERIRELRVAFLEREDREPTVADIRRFIPDLHDSSIAE